LALSFTLEAIMSKASRFLVSAATLVAAVTAQGTLAGQTVYAIGGGGSQLVRFDSDTPSAVTVVGSFNGANVFLDAIDFRLSDGRLYGYLDSTDSVYSIDLNTAALTLHSNPPSAAPTNTFQLGMDFNPRIDRLRVVTDSNQNIVYNPIAGTFGAFTNLFYGAGDPNANQIANIIENAYTQNIVGGVGTQQYAIDYVLDVLVKLDNNAGTLTTVGALGVDTDIYTGFDIYTTAGGVDFAYAILTGETGPGGFYTINLTTGAATLVGGLGDLEQVYSLAVVIPAPASVLALLVPACLVRRRRNG